MTESGSSSAKARKLWLQMTLKSGSDVILYTRRRVLLPSTLTGGEHVTGVAVRSARESFAIVCEHGIVPKAAPPERALCVFSRFVLLKGIGESRPCESRPRESRM